MSLYADSSALLKVYLKEPETESCKSLLAGDPVIFTARHTSIEVRRTLALALKGKAREEARREFRRAWSSFHVIELTKEICADACVLAETMPVRTLDSLHLAAAEKIRKEASAFVTYDGRQAETAKSLGWTVLGAPPCG